MARRREHLRNAPIVEAVVDFRVLRRERVSPDGFGGLQAVIGKQYSQAILMQWSRPIYPRSGNGADFKRENGTDWLAVPF